MRVRSALETDIAAMSALAKHAFRHAYAESSLADDLEVHLTEYFGEQAIADEMRRPGARYFVADDGGALVGLIKLRDSELPEAVPAETAIEVQQLYVDPAAQRGGIGHRLMQRAMDTAKKAGTGGIWLSVWTEADWATAFYRKFGFSAIGELDFYLGRTHYVDYLMWLPVNR